jgi:sugar phosphate isomerase/epimerase
MWLLPNPYYHPYWFGLTRSRPQVDYTTAWLQTVAAYQHLASLCAPVRVSIEFKPTDPSTRFSIVPNTGAAYMLTLDVARPNFGLTLDIGHVSDGGLWRARCGGAGDFVHKDQCE